MRGLTLGLLTAGLIGLQGVQTSAQDSLAGAYLSGRYATSQNDHAAAARAYNRALSYDAENSVLLNDAAVAFVMRGDFDTALDWVDASLNRESLGRTARLLSLAHAIKSGYYDEATEYLAADADVMSPILIDLLGAWISFGAGDGAAAAARFDQLGTQGMGVFGQFHKAMALAATGDFAAADAIMTGGDQGPLHLDANAIGAHANIKAQLGDFEGAIAIIDQTDPTGSDAGLSALRAELVSGSKPAFDTVRNAQDGAAEVFRALAQLLVGEENTDASLIYARFSQYLRPDQPALNILIGEILRMENQYALASEEFSKVPTDDPMFVGAELSRADALADAGEIEAAIAVLQGLERAAPEESDVPMTLGGILRFEERFEEAEVAYSRALDKLDETSPNLWRVLYARGIAFERTDRWDQAEADFRKALEISPNQPLVLNYLGYSLVEQKRNLEEALEMIKTAVEERPEDGYITDSLGWAYYRLGEFEKAVAPMERAAELVATDPIINDHLGDVYWMVGRKREAEFQWRRALSFEPEAEEIPKIRRKLEVGLDAFLEEQEDEARAATE